MDVKKFTTYLKNLCRDDSGKSVKRIFLIDLLYNFQYLIIYYHKYFTYTYF